MKIVSVCSTLDFINYTRRATLQAISRHVNEFEVILYAGINKTFKSSKTLPDFRFRRYNFWIPTRFRAYSILPFIEYHLKRRKWKQYFQNFDLVFFTDPNQYYLLPYISANKVAYLIRDPHCLFDPALKNFEQIMIERADIIFCTAQALANTYITKYYGINNKKTVYWPNTVDINIWNFTKFEHCIKPKTRFTAGILGNLTTYTDDLILLDQITDENPEVQFELSGKISPKLINNPLLKKILRKSNFLINEFLPFDELPARVINWDVGLIIADPDIEISRYIHNNKQFQYMAMGIPFITFNIHNDYNGFGSMVFLADSRNQYSDLIKKIKETYDSNYYREKGPEIAEDNSADHRALSFINNINDLLK
jgi:hypothetical protein